MKVVTDTATIDLGTTETTPKVGIVDYSRRVTDDFGVTTVVKRGFSRTLQARFSLPFTQVDAVQRQLADLRATPATWVADDRFAWLNFEGFYKDFSVDLSVPPTSFCTLTIEGLAETEAGADDGSDPAPIGSKSTLRVLQPMDVVTATLASSSVAENDYPAWSASTGYAAGQRVIVASTHRIYESEVNVAVGQDPTSTTGYWTDIGPTNRWAMFDQSLGTLTSAAGSISVVLNAVNVNALALLDVTGATVRVQATGYDQTHNVVDHAVTFLDLPLTTGSITVTITGSGTVSVGTLILGRLVTLGITEESPTAGITDYSRKDVDEFGAVTVVERSWAKKMAARSLFRTDALDLVANRVASVRGAPALWIADDATSSLTVYGFFKDFSIEVGETVSTLALSVEGLSEASPLAGTLTDLLNQLRPKTQWSSDGLGGTGASAWHADYVDGQDFFMRQSDDGGVTWGPSVRAIGVSSAQVLLFKRAPTTPAGPTTTTTYTFGTGVLSGADNGWTQSLPSSDGNPLWVILATAMGAGASDTIAAGEWSSAHLMAVDGAPGTPGGGGANNAQVVLYKRSAPTPTPARPSVTTTYTFASSSLAGADGGWTQAIPAANGNPLWVTAAAASNTAATDDIAPSEWATPVVMTQDGINAATIFLYKRAATTPAPAVPSVDSTYTFASGLLTGQNNGWNQTVPANDGNPLWVTTATALSGGAATDTITPAEWATPRIMAQDGAPGAPGGPGDPGPPGPPGPTISLSGNDISFDFMDGVEFDVNQTITVTATKQNTSEAINWSRSPAVTLGAPDGNTRTLSIANFGANQAVTITAEGAVSGAKASVTLIRNDQVTPDDSIIPDGQWIATAKAGGTVIGGGSSTPWRFSGTVRAQQQ